MLTLTAPGDREHRMPSGTMCRCTPAGGVNLAQWNATAGERWNRLCQELRRRWGFKAEYFKATEVQARGALHFHVLIRVPAQGLKLDRREMRAVRQLAIKHEFGHEVDIAQDVNEFAAGYCAKYVSKAAGERDVVPWASRQTGEVGLGGRYRTWTASRDWGVTMGSIRAAQAAWWAAGCPAPEAAPAAEEPGSLDHSEVCYTKQPIQIPTQEVNPSM